MKPYYTESDTLKALNISDFSQINSNNIMEFARLFKDIDPEIGKLALSKIPEFTTIITNVVEAYRCSYNRNVEALETSKAEYNDFCSRIVGVLSTMGEKDDNSVEDKAKIIDALLVLEARRSANDEAYRKAIQEEREAHNKHVDLAIGIVCSLFAALGGLVIGLGGGLGNSKK